MAAIIQAPGGRVRRVQPTPDMTPMVDLAFLLITFFIMVSSLQKPKVFELIYPAEGEPTPVNDKKVITILLGQEAGEVYFYYGMFHPEFPSIVSTDFSSRGLRQELSAVNAGGLKQLDEIDRALEMSSLTPDQAEQQRRQLYNREDAIFAVVKTLPDTPYRNVVDAIDELNLCEIQKRAIQPMSDEERRWMNKRSGN